MNMKKVLMLALAVICHLVSVGCILVVFVNTFLPNAPTLQESVAYFVVILLAMIGGADVVGKLMK